MATPKVIKQEPELYIVDDPDVSKFFLLQIDSVQSSVVSSEETTSQSQTEVTEGASDPVEQEELNINTSSPTKRQRKKRSRNRGSRPRGGFINYCSVCGKSFEKLPLYEMHMSKVHKIQPYECSTCGRKFSRKAYLPPHMRIHSGEKPYACKHCTASFSRASDFKKHIRSHQGIKSFKCELCDTRFTRKFSLMYHLRGHVGELPYVCEICGTRFRKSTGYYYHKKTQCKNTFECVDCKTEYKSLESLRSHLRKNH